MNGWEVGLRASRGHIWKILAAAAIPLALSAFVSLAALGAVGGGDPPTDVDGSGGQAVENSTQTDCQEANSQCQDDPSLDGGDEDECLLTVLTNGAHSYVVLNEHVSDPNMPEGGVAGNENALDRICYKALVGSAANTTLVPGKSEDAPGHSGDAPGKSEDAPGHGGDAPGNSDFASEGDAPGKSEDAPGSPDAHGQAGGQGQAKADANGNGPSDSNGSDKP